MSKQAILLSILLILLINHGCLPSSGDTAISNSQKSAEDSDNLPSDSVLVRETNAGTVIGFFDEYNTLAWLGIPYAKPPVGDLRWRAPQDPEPWNEPLDAGEFADPCPQICSILSMDKEKLGQPNGREDCLYLNVWRPDTDETLPVYFWIHGGGNSTGRTMDFNGAYFAEKAEAVYVCPAYRIGPFGWFKHASLGSRTAGDPLDGSGNFGTTDLIKALEWVRDNIARFGGDPDNVTIAGQSGGGANVFSLLLSPMIKYDENGVEKYLFHKAVCQSGRLKIYSHADAEKSAHDVITRLLINDNVVQDNAGADDFINDAENSAYLSDYLLSKPAHDILACGYETTVGGMLSFPRIFDDGNVIISNAANEFKKGNCHHVPMIIGANSDEAKIGLAIAMGNLTEEELIDAILNFDSENPNITFKDLISTPGIYEIISSIVTRAMHTAFITTPARDLSGYENLYVYEFSWDNEPDPFNHLLGACHAIELPFFTGSIFSDTHYLRIAWSPDNSDEVTALSEAMMAYWRNFIRTGDPNADDLVVWKPWSDTLFGRKRLILDADIHMSDLYPIF